MQSRRKTSYQTLSQAFSIWALLDQVGDKVFDKVRETLFLGQALSNQLLDHLRLRVHASQTQVQTLGPEGELFVVDAQQVQHCGVEVAHVNRVFNDVVGEIVGLAVNDAAFGAAASHPHSETTR